MFTQCHIHKSLQSLHCRVEGTSSEGHETTSETHPITQCPSVGGLGPPRLRRTPGARRSFVGCCWKGSCSAGRLPANHWRVATNCWQPSATPCRLTANCCRLLATARRRVYYSVPWWFGGGGSARGGLDPLFSVLYIRGVHSELRLKGLGEALQRATWVYPMPSTRLRDDMVLILSTPRGTTWRSVACGRWPAHAHKPCDSCAKPHSLSRDVVEHLLTAGGGRVPLRFHSVSPDPVWTV